MACSATQNARQTSKELAQSVGRTAQKNTEMTVHSASSQNHMAEVLVASIVVVIKKSGVFSGIQNVKMDSMLSHVVYVHPNVLKI